MELIYGLDMYVTRVIQSLHNTILDNIFSFITTLGNLGIIWIIISIALLCTRKYRKAGMVSIVALIIGALLGEVFLKNLFKRNRPFMVMEGIKTVVKLPTTYSFPSGHTTSSIAAMLSIVNNVKDKFLKVFVIVSAILITLSRLYLGVHFLTDILGGIALGILSYHVSKYINQRYCYK